MTKNSYKAKTNKQTFLCTNCKPNVIPPPCRYGSCSSPAGTGGGGHGQEEHAKVMICSSTAQWLAGLIDGNGCFLISKAGYASLEITMPVVDESLLQKIKHFFGGSVKMRSGSNSVRYRLHHAQGLNAMVTCVNGLLRNHIRQAQLKAVLQSMFPHMLYKQPSAYNWQCAYASGLFDSDGTVVISVKQHQAVPNLKGTYGKITRLQCATQMQLTISITQKYKHNVDFLTCNSILCAAKLSQQPVVQNQNCNNYYQQVQNKFGNIYYDKSQNGYYIWSISGRDQITLWLNYISHYPCNSKKAHRLRLIKTFYQLSDQKAYKAAQNSAAKKQWNLFACNWFKYS